MPRGDKTGPEGAGPMTGRGMGSCSGSGTPGSVKQGTGRGAGRRSGSGRGRRSGRGMRAGRGGQRD
ncbi:DUF5320 domain-containing protein [Candidatus Poribacteria bacterium]